MSRRVGGRQKRSQTRPSASCTAGTSAGDATVTPSLSDGGVVLRRAVALVALEAVARIVARQLHHQPVARHLGDDRRGRDRQAACASPLTMVRDGHRKPWRPVAVDGDELWLSGELRHGLRHRPQRGAENVLAVDAIDVGDADADDRAVA